MKRTIAIVAGGDSSEHDVSLRSAAGLMSFMDKERYDVEIVELRSGDAAALNRLRDFDFCYITIHGVPGENGILQGYFELIGMPYSTCGVLVEAMTYDKFVLNNYMRSWGMSVADSLLIKQGYDKDVSDADIISRIGLPCFVKPASGGSSFGTTKVKTADFSSFNTEGIYIIR